MPVATVLLAVAWAACVSAAATDRSAVLLRVAATPPPLEQLVLPSLLRLRGGVRELEDHSDWETVLAEAGDKLLVVDFTATWCGPCQRIAPAFAEIAEEYGDSAVFVKIDVDVLGDLAAELGVTSMPTFLFFRNGEAIDTMRGADEAGLRTLVKEVCAGTEPDSAERISLGGSLIPPLPLNRRSMSHQWPPDVLQGRARRALWRSRYEDRLWRWALAR